jgi:hypothetical protein
LPYVLALVALLAGCGRTELEQPEDVRSFDVADVPDARDARDGDAPDVPCRINSDCDNGVFCDGPELCEAGRCRPGLPVNCDDGVSCTADRCDEGTRLCVSTPDNGLCMAPAVCDLIRGCTTEPCRDNSMCDNGDPCDGVEICQAGRCVVGPPPVCNDGVPCTDDQCVPGRGCVNVPNNARCDDGTFCNGAETCNIMLGRCVAAPPVSCDDGNACTADRCDEASRSCVSVGTEDADGDGFPSARCGGSDCDDTNPRVNPRMLEICGDGVDNNCDGRSDCADPRCAGGPGCGPCTPTGPEGDPASCRDGRDNDCNGLVDCAEPRCMPFCGCVPTGGENTDFACRDGRDNDCDGALDCADTECRMVPGCVMCIPTGPEGDPVSCRDGRDNDCNGALDCADPRCAGTPACVPINEDCTTAARIGVPGTASGSTASARDDVTPPCGSSSAPDVVYVFFNPVRQTLTIDTNGSSYDTMLFIRRDNCTSGAVVGCDDDSGVGTASQIVLTNADPGTYYVFVDGWSSSRGAYQLHVTVGGPREDCANLVDDDGDGLVDCADVADCGTDPTCMMCRPTGPENTAVACTDGRDNDCDGFVDCLDTECRALPACGGCVPTGGENTAVACTDGRDNDCDRLLDCADPDCLGVSVCPCRPTGAENNAFACVDMRDNDCDGRTDCADPECAGVPACGGCVPTGGENTAVACADGRDNDCDRLTDCADPDCSGVGTCACVALPEACNDMRDNDCDRLTDCADPDCRTAPVCMACVPTGAENTDLACADGRDNDCDARLDCADPDCAGTRACMVCMPTGGENTDAECRDGRDNDCDRLTDCADPGCAMTAACAICTPTGAENTDAECRDGRDNDCDRLTDCADPGCALVAACCRPTGAENTDATCTDGRDNDCDRLRDCADPECAMAPTCVMCVPTGAEGTDASCTDGRDNDCDTAVDCADPGCFRVPACVPAPANDNCSRPIPVAVPSVTTGTTVGAAGDYTPTTAGFPGCAGGGGPDVVYTFTVTTTAPLTIDLTGAGFDPVLHVRRDTCATGTQVACNDDFVGTNSRVTFTATPGTYYVFVDGFGTTSAGSFTLTIAMGLPAEICDNFRDDDADSLVDCADPDCAMAPRCVCTPTGFEGTDATCTDGRDNDCDGLTDCADPNCGAVTACCRPTAEVCTDGRDNDCDGLVDCSDPNCSTNPACVVCMPGSESGPTACSDGRDNDCDGRTDCNDPDCRPFMDPMAECCNGRDDNGNGLIDEFACTCRTNADCSSIGSGGSFPSTTCYASTLSLCGPPCNRLGGDFFCDRLLPGSRCDLATGQCR